MANVTGIPHALSLKPKWEEVTTTLKRWSEWAAPTGGTALMVGMATLANHPGVAQTAFAVGAVATTSLAIGGLVGKASDLCIKASDFVKSSPHAIKRGFQAGRREHDRFSQEFALQGLNGALKDFAQRHYPSAQEFVKSGWDIVWRNRWPIIFVMANMYLMDCGADMFREMATWVPENSGATGESFRDLANAMAIAVDPTGPIAGIPMIGAAYTKLDKIEEIVSTLQSKFEGDRFREERYLYIEDLAEILSEQRGWIERTSLYEKAERQWRRRQNAIERGETGVVNYPHELLGELQEAAATGKRPEADGVTHGAISIVQRFEARLDRRMAEIEQARTAVKRAGPSM